jgi:hypothetical protein
MPRERAETVRRKGGASSRSHGCPSARRFRGDVIIELQSQRASSRMLQQSSRNKANCRLICGAGAFVIQLWAKLSKRMSIIVSAELHAPRQQKAVRLQQV